MTKRQDEDKQSIKFFMNSFVAGRVSHHDITMLLQTYIQQYGGLDETDPDIQKFLIAYRGKV